MYMFEGGGIGGSPFPEFPENFPGIDLIPGFPGKKCLIPGIPGTAIIFGNKLIVNTEETCQRYLHICALIVTSQNNGSLNMIMCTVGTVITITKISIRLSYPYKSPQGVSIHAFTQVFFSFSRIHAVFFLYFHAIARIFFFPTK